MKNAFLISFLLFIISCTSKNVETSNEFRLRKTSVPLNLSKYFNSVSTYSLQSDEPVGSIDKIIVGDSKIFISDYVLMKSLRAFDQNGRETAFRDDIGEGPMGLSQINDFQVYNDTLYVLDAYRRKLLTFSLNLETIAEYDVPVPSDHFLINKAGIFLLKQGDDNETGRLIHYSHQLELIATLIPSEELSTQIVLSGSDFFIPIDDTSFIFYNPFYPNIWIYRNQRMEKVELNFNGQFIDVKELANLEPLEKLRFANTFENFYNITNGIKLSDSEFLFSIRYRKKNGYLKLDFNTMEMTYMDQIKNDLMKVPSTISFSGNSSNNAWYWMDQEDIEKFYSINNSKIPQDERIELGVDPESKIIFKLKYR